MKHRKFIFNVMAFLLTGAVTGGCLLTSCDDWTDPEEVDYDIAGPQEQNPELYARYMQSLKDYKSRIHPIVYARLDNAPEVSTGEKDFLRSLPDSLDIVSFYHSDHLTSNDIEDIPIVQEKSTRVIYYADISQGTSHIDQAIADMEKYNFDGISIGYIGGDEIDAQVIEKLAAVAGTKAGNGKLLMYEGNPVSIPSAQRNYFNYIVLNTAGLTNTFELEMQIHYANGFAGIPFNRILATARPVPLTGDNTGGMITNEENVSVDAIPETARRSVSAGPTAGIGIYNVGDDYYNATGNYPLTRKAIQILNPSPIN